MAHPTVSQSKSKNKRQKRKMEKNKKKKKKMMMEMKKVEEEKTLVEEEEEQVVEVEVREEIKKKNKKRKKKIQEVELEEKEEEVEEIKKKKNKKNKNKNKNKKRKKILEEEEKEEVHATNVEEMDKFYKTHRSYVYVIRIEGGDDIDYCTGFAISRDLLLSRYRRVFEDRSITIVARRDSNYLIELKIIDSDPSLGLVLLKVNGESLEGGYGRFAEDGRLEEGQKIYGMANVCFSDLSYSVGKIGYPCPRSFSISDLPDLVCESYTNDVLTRPNQLPYRVFGNFFDKSSFQYNSSVHSKLNPLIPLVECMDFVYSGSADGGIVLNEDGYIVGMIVTGGNETPIAIHVSVLRGFVDRYRDRR